MRTVLRCALQTVEKLPKPSKHDIFTKEYFCDLKFFFRFLIGIGLKLLIILHFDFLREPHSDVPLYADECGSLGFVAFSTVSSVSKNTFRHADAHRFTVRICYISTNHKLRKNGQDKVRGSAKEGVYFVYMTDFAGSRNAVSQNALRFGGCSASSAV